MIWIINFVVSVTKPDTIRVTEMNQEKLFALA